MVVSMNAISDVDDMGAAFVEWQKLSEAYESAIEELRVGEPGAAAALKIISRDLQMCAGALAQRRAAKKDSKH